MINNNFKKAECIVQLYKVIPVLNIKLKKFNRVEF